MRVVSWNCNRPGPRRDVWSYLIELRPDIAILQEVNEIPESISEIYRSVTAPSRKKDGTDQAFRTAILTMGYKLDWCDFERKPIPNADPSLQSLY